jgi:1,2-diacylglycerol 3-beta-galactosyltransferase
MTVSALAQRGIPLLTVVTDLVTVHRLWFHDAADLCLVPTRTVRDRAIECGLPAERVQITGIPVTPRLARRPASREALRAQLGWQPDVTTVLAVGSKRVGNLPDFLHVLNHSGLPIQLAVVAGGDDALYQQLSNTEWHRPTRVYNYVKNMPELLQAADCLISKAGGLITSEALACGLPLLLVDVIPGQETGNASHVIEGGAGALADNPVAGLEILFHWLDHGGELLHLRAQYAQRLGRPRAAYDVADLAWQAASQGLSAKRREASLRSLPRLTNLLSRNGITWQ